MTPHFPARRFPFFLLLLSLLLNASLPARAGLFSISPDKEKSIGADAAKQIEAQAPIVTGPVASWVEAVGARLAQKSDPEFQYSFRVIESPEINAFTLPGGYIYVYTGLRQVAPTEDELAAVLAHEITHAEEHHYALQYRKSSRRGLLLGVGSLLLGLPDLANQVIGLLDFARTQKYSRAQEAEADRLGMERMARAGYDPKGMVSLLDKLSQEDKGGGTLDKWFGDHPDAASRVEATRAQLAKMQASLKPSAPLKPAAGP
jgi:predicted Zn-dependent protease